MGFFTVSFQHWLMGTFSYITCFFTYCISCSRAFRILLWHRPSTFPLESNSAPAQSVRLDSSDCASSVAPLQYLGSHVDGPSLRSARQVHHGGCVALRRQLVAQDPRRSRSPDSLDVWILAPVFQCGLFVVKLTRPPSRLSLASPNAWKTSCLHSTRIMQG